MVLGLRARINAVKKDRCKNVIIAVGRKEMPPMLAPIPIPMLLQEREAPSKIVARRESGRRRGAPVGTGSMLKWQRRYLKK